MCIKIYGCDFKALSFSSAFYSIVLRQCKQTFLWRFFFLSNMEKINCSRKKVDLQYFALEHRLILDKNLC